jgi:hypothetical protein
VVVDGVDHNPDDPLVGVGDEAADLVRQRHTAGRHKIGLVEEHRRAVRRRCRAQRRMRGEAGALFWLSSDGPLPAQQRRPARRGDSGQHGHTHRPAVALRRCGGRPSFGEQVLQQDMGNGQAHAVADHDEHRRGCGHRGNHGGQHLLDGDEARVSERLGAGPVGEQLNEPGGFFAALPGSGVAETGVGGGKFGHVVALGEQLAGLVDPGAVGGVAGGRR